MKISTASKGDNLIIRLHGELDMNTVPDFKEKIKKLNKKNNKNIIINMSKIKFIDSTGIGAILGRYRSIKNDNGQLIIVGINDRVKKIFKLSGIYDLIPIYKSEKKALSNNNLKGGK